MIRWGCASCGNMSQMGPEELQRLFDVIKVCGPSEEHHMVIKFDCQGKMSPEELENPSWALGEAGEKIAGAANLKELFGE